VTGSAVVLMSVYGLEHSDNLDQCLDSIVNQTHVPQKIVLVKDGPLSESLDAVIDRYAGRYDLFKIVALAENRGLVHALNTGLQYCDCEYTFRMDSDDLSLPNRFETQLQFMQKHPEIGVLSSAMYEFDDDPDQPQYVKTVAANHEAIVKQFPWRNPINHAACCYRTELIRNAGGYPDLLYLEDYYLWSILLCRGIRFHNLTEPLYLCRFNRATLSRRGGWINFRNECSLRWFLYRNHKSSAALLLASIVLQVILRFAPISLRNLLWNTIRRRVS
jgi:glycosyltransferase involved in cell wall biosynthesis